MKKRETMLFAQLETDHLHRAVIANENAFGRDIVMNNAMFCSEDQACDRLIKDAKGHLSGKPILCSIDIITQRYSAKKLHDYDMKDAVLMIFFKATIVSDDIGMFERTEYTDSLGQSAELFVITIVCA